MKKKIDIDTFVASYSKLSSEGSNYGMADGILDKRQDKDKQIR